MLEATIKPVKSEPKPPETLADVEPFVLCLVSMSAGKSLEAWRDGLGETGTVWRVNSEGRPTYYCSYGPNEFQVIEVIGPLVFPTAGTKVKVELPEPQTLDELESWEFAVVKYRGNKCNYHHCRCEDEVFYLSSMYRAPFPAIGKPSEYTVIGRSLGQLQIEDKEPDDG